MEDISKSHVLFFLMMALTASLNLQGCAVSATTGEPNGLILVIFGIVLVFVGYRLAVRSTLEQWAMKLLKVGALFFLG
jgi:hypothetical protein